MTAAAAIGMTKSDVDTFIKRLSKLLSKSATENVDEKCISSSEREKLEDKGMAALWWQMCGLYLLLVVCFIFMILLFEACMYVASGNWYGFCCDVEIMSFRCVLLARIIWHRMVFIGVWLCLLFAKSKNVTVELVYICK